MALIRRVGGLLVSAGLLMGALPASAVTLAYYDLSPARGIFLDVTTVAPGVSASPLALYNSANTHPAFDNHFYHDNWAPVIVPDRYYELTIAAAPAFALATIDFSLEEAGGSPGSFALRSNLDGFASDLGTGVFTGTLVTDFSIDVSSLGVLASPLTLRWYLTASVSTARAGFANHECPGSGCGLADVGQDLRIEGTIVPEPSTSLLLGGGLLALASRSRRRGR